MWQRNSRLGAIALALEALRAVDRYGVTQGNEQYRGWARLQSPSTEMRADAAALLIEKYSAIHADIFRSADTYRAAYRTAAGRIHPDRAGGSHEAFVELGRAKEALDKHHGL